MENKGYTEACKGCKNWLEVKILMDGWEGDEDITIWKCKYQIPETLEEESSGNYCGIKTCSMRNK